MLFMPALAMRLWAEEASQGTSELLLSLPVSLSGLVIGKLLAAWTVAAIALVLTFPWWITVNILGPADNPAIALTYFVSLIMAGGYLAIGAAVSALTRSAVLAFVIGVGRLYPDRSGLAASLGAIAEVLDRLQETRCVLIRHTF